MNRQFLDTSFVIALVNDKDNYFSKAQELSPIYIKNLLITTDAVLLEIGNALSKDFRTEAAEIIEILRNSRKTEVVEIDSTLFDKGLTLYKAYKDKKWGLVDCISFVVMQEHDVSEALTSDKHFVQAGFRALMLESIN